MRALRAADAIGDDIVGMREGWWSRQRENWAKKSGEGGKEGRGERSRVERVPKLAICPTARNTKERGNKETKKRDKEITRAPTPRGGMGQLNCPAGDIMTAGRPRFRVVATAIPGRGQHLVHPHHAPLPPGRHGSTTPSPWPSPHHIHRGAIDCLESCSWIMGTWRRQFRQFMLLPIELFVLC